MAHAPRPRGVALGDRAPHLFLSHSSKDNRWVSGLAEHLNLCGVDVWLDTWELRVGDDLHERIADAIHKSRFVGVVVTRHFNESKWIKGEVHQALSREKAEDRTIVLPLLAGGAAPAVLSAKKFLDFEAEYWPSLVRLCGLIHDLETDRVESQLADAIPDSITASLRVLEYAGWRSVHVVGTKTLEEIVAAGGEVDGDIVHFYPEELLAHKTISRPLRRWVESLSKSSKPRKGGFPELRFVASRSPRLGQPSRFLNTTVLLNATRACRRSSTLA
jgi:hypothetical protein